MAIRPKGTGGPGSGSGGASTAAAATSVGGVTGAAANAAAHHHHRTSSTGSSHRHHATTTGPNATTIAAASAGALHHGAGAGKGDYAAAGAAAAGHASAFGGGSSAGGPGLTGAASNLGSSPRYPVLGGLATGAASRDPAALLARGYTARWLGANISNLTSSSSSSSTAPSSLHHHHPGKPSHHPAAAAAAAAAAAHHHPHQHHHHHPPGKPVLTILSPEEIEKDLRHMQAYSNAVCRYQQQYYLQSNKNHPVVLAAAAAATSVEGAAAGATTGSTETSATALTISLDQNHTPPPESALSSTGGTGAAAAKQAKNSAAAAAVLTPLISLPVKIDPEEEKRLQVLRQTIARAEAQREELELQYVALRAHYVLLSQTVQQSQQDRATVQSFLQELCRARAACLGLMRAKVQMGRDILRCLQHRNALLALDPQQQQGLEGETSPMDIDDEQQQQHGVEALADLWDRLEEDWKSAVQACYNIPVAGMVGSTVMTTTSPVPPEKSLSSGSNNKASGGKTGSSTSENNTNGNCILSWPCTQLPVTPFNVPLLCSNISEVPEKSLAFGAAGVFGSRPESLAWMPEHIWRQETQSKTQSQTSGSTSSIRSSSSSPVPPGGAGAGTSAATLSQNKESSGRNLHVNSSWQQDPDEDWRDAAQERINQKLRDEVAFLEAEFERERYTNQDFCRKIGKSRTLNDEWIAMMSIVRQETEAILHRHNILLDAHGEEWDHDDDHHDEEDDHHDEDDGGEHHDHHDEEEEEGEEHEEEHEDEDMHDADAEEEGEHHEDEDVVEHAEEKVEVAEPHEEADKDVEMEEGELEEGEEKETPQEQQQPPKNEQIDTDHPDEGAESAELQHEPVVNSSQESQDTKGSSHDDDMEEGELEEVSNTIPVKDSVALAPLTDKDNEVAVPSTSPEAVNLASDAIAAVTTDGPATPINAELPSVPEAGPEPSGEPTASAMEENESNTEAQAADVSTIVPRDNQDEKAAEAASIPDSLNQTEAQAVDLSITASQEIQEEKAVEAVTQPDSVNQKEEEQPKVEAAPLESISLDATAEAVKTIQDSDPKSEDALVSDAIKTGEAEKMEPTEENIQEETMAVEELSTTTPAPVTENVDNVPNAAAPEVATMEEVATPEAVPTNENPTTSPNVDQNANASVDVQPESGMDAAPMAGEASAMNENPAIADGAENDVTLLKEKEPVLQTSATLDAGLEAVAQPSIDSVKVESSEINPSSDECLEPPNIGTDSGTAAPAQVQESQVAIENQGTVVVKEQVEAADTGDAVEAVPEESTIEGDKVEIKEPTMEGDKVETKEPATSADAGNDKNDPDTSATGKRTVPEDNNDTSGAAAEAAENESSKRQKI